MSFRNVTSSIDVVKFSNNVMLAWPTTSGVTKRIGLSSDNQFIVPASIDSTGYNASVGRLTMSGVISGDSDYFGTRLLTTTNQSCLTTCGSNAAVFGYDISTTKLVSPDDSIADMCVCTG